VNQYAIRWRIAHRQGDEQAGQIAIGKHQIAAGSIIHADCVPVFLSLFVWRRAAAMDYFRVLGSLFFLGVAFGRPMGLGGLSQLTCLQPGHCLGLPNVRRIH